MSESEAKRFVGDIGQSETMQAEAKEAGGIDALAVYAQFKGYDVTAEELSRLSQQEGEISDEDLNKVAGGYIGQNVNRLYVP